MRRTARSSQTYVVAQHGSTQGRANVGAWPGNAGRHRESVTERVEWYPDGRVSAATRTHQSEWSWGSQRRTISGFAAWRDQAATWLADVVGISLVLIWVAAAVWAGWRLGSVGGALVMTSIVSIILVSSSPRR